MGLTAWGSNHFDLVKGDWFAYELCVGPNAWFVFDFLRLSTRGRETLDNG